MIEVVGIGDSGIADLPAHLIQLITSAPVVVGGRRHLDLLPASPQDRHPWPSPLKSQLEQFLADLPAGAVVLASGDPLRSGIGTTLVELLGADRVRIHPALSADTLVRARLGWSAESTTVVTTVGRSLGRVIRELAPGARLVVLCSDGRTPAELAKLLRDNGIGDATLSAWWHLGGSDEGSRIATADRWDDTPTPDLVTCAVVVPATADLPGRAPGRPEEAYDTDGQLTKRDLRASAISRLRPHPGELLWDLGAGTGSVGVEWCLLGGRCVSVERNPERAARVRRNAELAGIDDLLEVREQDCADALAGSPDAVFVGGGLTDAVLEQSWAALRPGGRLVAHAVTLETEAILVAARRTYGGELTRITVEQAQPLGSYLSWQPNRAVVQWNTRKTG